MHKFIGSETIGIVTVRSGSLCRLSPVPEVGAARALVGGADSIAPVVAIGETSAGKAHNGRFDPGHLVHQFFPNAVDVWDPGILTHPNAVVNDATEILHKVAVDIGRDRSDELVENNFDTRVRALSKSQ